MVLVNPQVALGPLRHDQLPAPAIIDQVYRDPGGGFLPPSGIGPGRQGFLGLWPAEMCGAVAIRGGQHIHYARQLPQGTLDAVNAQLAALGYDINE